MTFFSPLPFPKGTKREARHGGRETGRKAGEGGKERKGERGGDRKKQLKIA